MHSTEKYRNRENWNYKLLSRIVIVLFLSSWFWSFYGYTATSDLSFFQATVRAFYRLFSFSFAFIFRVSLDLFLSKSLSIPRFTSSRPEGEWHQAIRQTYSYSLKVFRGVDWNCGHFQTLSRWSWYLSFFLSLFHSILAALPSRPLVDRSLSRLLISFATWVKKERFGFRCIQLNTRQRAKLWQFFGANGSWRFHPQNQRE